jgi:hypothetical protein
MDMIQCENSIDNHLRIHVQMNNNKLNIMLHIFFGFITQELID